MQAAASLFMNRPGHRGATSSIGGDSLNSELVSYTSHDPILSSRPNPRAAPPSSPPTDSPLLTLNTLDPVERAALIRQSRKINKVLGATPRIAEAPPQPGSSARPLHQRRGTISSLDAVHQSWRPATASISNTGLSRGRVSKSLVVSVPKPGQFTTPDAPFLRIASNSGTPRSPASPTLRRRASDTSIASSATGPSFAFAPPSPAPEARPRTSNIPQSRPSQESAQTPDSQMSPADPLTFDSQASLIRSIDSSLSLSLASPVFSPQTTEDLQRQQTRARVAKLQRLMGENVPSELVLPTPGRHSMSSRRRLSIDLPPIAKGAGRPEPPKHKHKRTKSMWKKDSKDDAGFESAPESADPLRSKQGKKVSDGLYSRSGEDTAPIDALQPPLTERQKALNVKRAMKMAQVFGVPPPQDLYQIQSSSTRSSDTRNLSRQSLVSLASLAYLLDHDRDSLYDMLANTPELAEEGEDEDPLEWPYERRGLDGDLQLDTVDPQDKATIEKALKRGASTKSKSLSSSGRGSPNMSSSPLGATSRVGSRSDVNLVPTADGSPVSTSNITKSGSLRRAKSKERIDGVAKLRKDPPPPVPSSPVPGSSRWAGSSGQDTVFTARRRRANKLSRFFGVGYQDLFNTMLFGIPGSPTSGSNEDPTVSQEAPPRRSGGGTVVVVTDDGKEIDLRKSTMDWSASVDQQDLKAMMGRLRALKL